MKTYFLILVFMVNFSLINCRYLSNEWSAKILIDKVRFLRSPDEKFDDNYDEEQDIEVVSHF